MIIFEVLKKLRDDIISWCSANFARKLNKNLGADKANAVLATDTNGEITTSTEYAKKNDIPDVSSFVKTTDLTNGTVVPKKASTASTATTATNVGTLTNNDNVSNANVRFTIGNKTFSKTVNNVANATNATNATNDSDGRPINKTYIKQSDIESAVETAMAKVGVATTEKQGVVKVGNNLSITKDGVLSAIMPSVATSAANGLLSATDKVKLDSMNLERTKMCLIITYTGTGGYSKAIWFSYISKSAWNSKPTFSALLSDISESGLTCFSGTYLDSDQTGIKYKPAVIKTVKTQNKMYVYGYDGLQLDIFTDTSDINGTLLGLTDDRYLSF